VKFSLVFSIGIEVRVRSGPSGVKNSVTATVLTCTLCEMAIRCTVLYCLLYFVAECG